jgi:CrcB protein
MIRHLLFVAVGGAAGSIARYLCQRWVSANFQHPFPWGTFIVNFLGCLLIGILWGISFKTFDRNEQLKLLLMVGFCGGFTTFSAFTLEGIGLIRENRIGLFMLYTGGSIIAGLLATYAGMKLIR